MTEPSSTKPSFFAQLQDALPKLNELGDFWRFLLGRFVQDRCTQIAGSLTFTTLLSMVPLFTVLVTLLSASPIFEDFMTQVKIWLLLNMVPDVAGKIITVYMTQFTENATRLSAVGVAFLVLTALSLLLTIDMAFNSIWRVRRPRPWLTSLLVYWALITLGPIVIGLSLSAKVYVESFTKPMWDALPFGNWMALKLVPFSLEVFVLFVFYRIVPNRFVLNTHAFVGALFAAAAFAIMKQALALYVKSVPTYSLVYGTFASIPILLLWLYLMWLVILLGAEVAAGLAQWRGGLRIAATSAHGENDRPKRAKHGQLAEVQELRFRYGLMLMKALVKAQAIGQTVPMSVLRAQAKVPYDVLEDLLDALLIARIVERTQQGQYVLVSRPDQLKLASLYQLFVLHGFEIGHETYEDISPAVASALSERNQKLDISLAQAFADELTVSDSGAPVEQA
jgi:membrane protein